VLLSDYYRTIYTLKTLGQRRDEILALAADHRASNVRVFGSAARGEAWPNSDVDFLVQWNYDRVSAWGGVGLDFALEDLLGCKVDVLSENGLSPLLRQPILMETILL
jgi:predicted nucleotidyltransferase